MSSEVLDNYFSPVLRFFDQGNTHAFFRCFKLGNKPPNYLDFFFMIVNVKVICVILKKVVFMKKILWKKIGIVLEESFFCSNAVS